MTVSKKGENEMQQLTIIGNLTKEPETRSTPNGNTVCSFTVAVNRRKKTQGQPEADFFRVSAWGKLGENCQKYLTKGKKVFVAGTVSAHAYNGQNGAAASLEVFATDVEFLSPKDSGSGLTPVETDELPWGDN